MSGVEILQAIQTIQSPLLDRVLGLITNLHHEAVYILVLPLIYWLYDKRFGRYMFSVFVIGFWSNDFLKEVFRTPRPDPAQVRVILAETGGGYAFPSGHAETPLVFWGAIADHVRRRWFTWAAGILVFLIGFSRLYIGVHWPLDVIGGWAIRLVVLWLMVRSRRFWTGEGQSLGLQALLAFLLPGAARAARAAGPGGRDRLDGHGHLSGCSWGPPWRSSGCGSTRAPARRCSTC